METTLDIALRTPIEPAPRRPPARPTPPDEGPSLQSAADARFAVAVASSRGPHHPANEDAASVLGVDPSLFVVADGVGGGAMARLASASLVAMLHEALAGPGAPTPTPEAVRRAVLEADRAIAARIACVTAEPGAATLVLAAPLDGAGSRWLVAWVGDCRAYRLARGRPSGTGRRAARLDLLTRDDTFRHLREPVPRGSRPDDPARMVGNGATTGANVAVHDLGPGELLALCSDGVHRRLGAGDWRRVLLQRVPLVERCGDAIRVARANGSTDDATVLLVERPALAGAEPGPAPAGALRRLLRGVRDRFAAPPFEGDPR